MARLYDVGFELQSTTTGVEYTQNGLGTGDGISTSVFRSGAASLNYTATDTFSWIKQQFRSANAATETFIRGCYKFNTLPGSAVHDLMCVTDLSATPQGYIKFDGTTQKIGLYDSGGTIVGTGASVVTGQWYVIEMDVKAGAASTGTLKARLDGVQFASNTAITVANFGQVYFGPALNSGSVAFNLDDISINDTSGSQNTSYPGLSFLDCLRPNATGDANSFSVQTGGTAGAANNFTRVDETTPNDATDFNGSATLNQEDLFNMTNTVGASGDTYNNVGVYFRFRNSVADTTATIKVECEKTSAGTIAQSAAIVPNSVTWKSNGTTTAIACPLILGVDPDSGVWTQTTVNSMQAGYKLTVGPGTAGREIDVTAVWTYVDYTVSTFTFQQLNDISQPYPDKNSIISY